MLFNFLKRNNPPTERCKLLKEKILDVVEPVFVIGTWGWHKNTMSLYYHPQYNYVFLYSQRGVLEELSKKEVKWLTLQAEEVIRQKEDKAVKELLEKLRAL